MKIYRKVTLHFFALSFAWLFFLTSCSSDVENLVRGGSSASTSQTSTTPAAGVSKALAFTGNSLSSTAIATRVFDNTIPYWTLTGECDSTVGTVEISSRGIMPTTYNTTCNSADGTFTQKIYTDGATQPYFSNFTNYSPDPQIMIRQGSNIQITRIYFTTVGWTNVFITTPAQLQAMIVAGAFQTRNYFLVNDIDLSTVAPTNNFTPRGTAAGNYWSGHLYGDGRVIRNLHINGGGGNYKGLIGYANGYAAVFDLHFETATIINSSAWVGVLAGELRQSFAVRTSVTGGSVSTPTGGLMALLVGESWDGWVYDSWTSGSVSGDGTIGGIMGQARGADIHNSWSEAQVSASSNASVGGLVGSVMQGFDVYIDNSFATGNVTSGASDGAGGFLGFVNNGVAGFATIYIDKVFSFGNVSAASSTCASYAIGCSGMYAAGPPESFFPSAGVNMTNIYHANSMTCTNCSPLLATYNYSTGNTVNAILGWAQANWDFTRTWKMHSLGMRPDLIGNPKP